MQKFAKFGLITLRTLRGTEPRARECLIILLKSITIINDWWAT